MSSKQIKNFLKRAIYYLTVFEAINLKSRSQQDHTFLQALRKNHALHLLASGYRQPLACGYITPICNSPSSVTSFL